MRLTWFSSLSPLRRRGSRRTRKAPASLRVRRLERRRVLDAGVAGLVTTSVVAADTPAVASSETSQEPLVFDWTTTAEDVGQSNSTTTNQPSQGNNSSTEQANPPADEYAMALQGAGASSMVMAANVSANVRPVLIAAQDQAVMEGQLLDLSGMGGAPPLGLYVDPDVGDTHTATVNWGDGSPTEATAIFPAVGAGALGGTHTYADNGMYTVTVSVMDASGASDTRTFKVTVGNVAPTATLTNNGPVNEGSTATVTFVSQFDPSTADTAAGFHYAYDLDNDGAFDVGDGTYAGSGISGSQIVPASFFAEGPSSHTVSARIIDKDGGFNDYTTQIDVLNVAPVLANITGDTINEGQTATIGATINDPSVSDVFSVDVNWIDGTSDTISGLGSTNSSGTIGGTGYVWTAVTRRLELSHLYVDDGPNPGGGVPTHDYAVALTVSDGQDASGPFSANVEVNNLRPVLIVASPSPIDEGQLLDLSGLGGAPPLGLFVDSGKVDTHTATVNWGDGSPTENATVFPGVGSGALGGTHTYADDGIYVVTVMITDDDGGSDTRTFQVVVNNVPPVVDLTGPSVVDEGAPNTWMLGPVVDPGADTVSQFIVHWGDGSSDTFTAVQIASMSGMVDHTYADGPNSYTISVDLVDEDGTYVSVDTLMVSVNNVPPDLAPIGNRTVDEGTQLSFADLGLITDPGFRDLALATDETFVYWIDWGDRAPLAPVTGSATIDHIGGPMDPTRASFDGSHTYADDGDYTVTLRVADDDMGAFTNAGLFESGAVGTDFVERQFIVHVDNVMPTVVVPNGNLTVFEGETISFSDLATFTDPGFDNPLNPNAAVPPLIVDPLNESFTYDIDWGDGRNPIVGMTIADMNGSVGTPSSGTIPGSHVYADDGVYQVTVTVRDDNGGVGINTFLVTVNNVAPSLTGDLASLEVDEGLPFVLSDLGGSTFNLGLGISDTGFDNPLNPSGATQETFTGVTIDWGDGTTSDALMITGRVSDLVDGPTTALLQHKPHVYADNGDYTVTIIASDDNGGALAPQQIVIHVNNVAPTLTLTTDSFTVTEGSVMNIPNLGTFTDPGFTDAANLPPSVETFTYWINWGDGTIESGQLPATVTQGMRPDMLTPELTIPTLGTLADSHLYADNPAGGNEYTITVRLADDDMSANFAAGVDGIDFVERQIVVTVLNVDPTLQPLTATDVETSGRATVSLSFADPGADSFQVLVDWGDQLSLPPDQRFVVETVHAGPAVPGSTVSMTLEHFYTGPPNPLNPSADIIISVMIFDDDALTMGVVAPGISNLESVAISNPGIETTNVAIDTTPQVPRLEFLTPPPPEVLLNQQPNTLQTLDTFDTRAGGGEMAAASDRYLVLVVISPEGEPVESHRLKEEALMNLRGLFATLPENHYQIYLVRTENNSWRLVIDVYVRRYYDRTLREWRGRVVDLSDESEGTRDRPPTSEISVPSNPVPLEGNPFLEDNPDAAPPDADPQAASGQQPSTDHAAAATPTVRSLRWAVPLAAVALQSRSESWSQRLDAALGQATDRNWQRLRRAGRVGRSGQDLDKRFANATATTSEYNKPETLVLSSSRESS